MATASTPNLSSYLSERYAAIKEKYPGEGRRKWRLHVAEEFWKLQSEEKERKTLNSTSISTDDADFENDDDPSDCYSSEEIPGFGILIRTDFSNEEAWKNLLSKVKEGEAEFAATVGEDEDESMEDDAALPSGSGSGSNSITDKAPKSDAQMEVENNDGQEEDEEEDEDDGSLPPIFTTVDPPPALQNRLNGISNLTALRLFNDVNIRRAPRPPPGTKRIKPGNRLIDLDGWQEIYEGKRLWLYDAKSNTDGCVRVVSPQSASSPYGTATADSWRARVSHICELQVNIASGAMSIDFGGLDKYDYAERVRNLEEADKTSL
ncbi:hypothetical protein ABKN59_010592 [Abortiporus biennis]